MRLSRHMTIDQLRKAIETLKADIAEMQVQFKRAGEDHEKENNESLEEIERVGDGGTRTAVEPQCGTAPQSRVHDTKGMDEEKAAKAEAEEEKAWTEGNLEITGIRGNWRPPTRTA